MTEFSVERFLAEVANGRLCRSKEPDIASLIGTWLCEFECSSRTGQAYDISGAECVVALAAAGYEIVPLRFGTPDSDVNVISPHLYARKGEEVTCENGHVICEVAKDIPRMAMMWETSYFHRWRDPEPKLGTMPDEINCGRCGAKWFGSTNGNFHFKDGWRC